MDYRIEEKEAFDVIEKVETHSVENAQNDASIPDFWARANADGTLEKLSALTSDKKYIFGICYANKSKDSVLFDYSIAAACDKDTVVPDGFRKNRIPKRTWLVFGCVGAIPGAIQEAWRKIVSEFFEASVYKPTYEMDIEAYTDGDMDSPDYYSEIWVPIEKNI